MSGFMRHDSRDGFSLIEVLIALTILAVGLLGIALLQITAVKGNAMANETALATLYAQNRMERFRRIPFDNIVSSTGIDGTTQEPNFAVLPTTSGIEKTTTKKGVVIYRVWSVVNTSSTLKTISVWACWVDDKGKWHTARMATQRGNLL